MEGYRRTPRDTVPIAKLGEVHGRSGRRVETKVKASAKKQDERGGTLKGCTGG